MTTKTTKDLYYSAWATAWGPIGAVMGARGLRRLVLPHYQLKDLLALLAWEHPGALKDDKPFDGLIERTREYFNGKSVDFSEVVCDLPGEGTLGGLVLRSCRKIPYGQSRSYHVLAETISRPDAARAVAGALGKNNIPLVVPCHRVTYADGTLGGFSAAGGTELKQRMLNLERRGDPTLLPTGKIA